MTIENVRRFYHAMCGYVTENEDEIERIEHNHGICPACNNNRPRMYAYPTKEELYRRLREQRPPKKPVVKATTVQMELTRLRIRVARLARALEAHITKESHD